MCACSCHYQKHVNINQAMIQLVAHRTAAQTSAAAQTASSHEHMLNMHALQNMQAALQTLNMHAQPGAAMPAPAPPDSFRYFLFQHMDFSANWC